MGVNGWFGNWSSSNEGYASGSFITEASINGTSATKNLMGVYYGNRRFLNYVSLSVSFCFFKGQKGQKLINLLFESELLCLHF